METSEGADTLPPGMFFSPGGNFNLHLLIWVEAFGQILFTQFGCAISQEGEDK